MATCINLARIEGSTAMHHVVEPSPLRGAWPAQVKSRCGRRGAPTVIARGIDARAVRIREGVVCVTCMDLAARNG